MKNPQFFLAEQGFFVHQAAALGKVLTGKLFVVKDLTRQHFPGIRGGAVGGEHITEQVMFLAGQSHAVVFRQLVGTVGQLFIGVRVGAVPADAHLDRCVLGGVVDKPHDLILHSDKRVLDHRIRLGEVGHKLIFIVDVRNIIRRLGPLYIKALSGELLKEQPVKICFAPQPANLLFTNNPFVSSPF